MEFMSKRDQEIENEFENSLCNEYAKEFALRLSPLRDSHGSSAREMSLALDYNHSYINSVENLKFYPTTDAVFRICEYLNITPAEFFSPINGTKKDKRAELHELLALLSDSQVEAVHTIVSDITKGNSLDR